MSDVTTIKVPRALRERISRAGRHRGVTAAVLIGELLDSYDRERRLAAVSQADDVSADAHYVEETAAWDKAADDGLKE
ncbi:MAG: hypothetical protein ACR2JG_04605 [Geodermatophilaceae bacterium]